MFTHPTFKDNHLIRVEFSDYSKKHFCKKFEKKYHSRQWTLATEAIIFELSHIKSTSNNIQESQRVDELWHANECWIFKYDFTIPGTKVSPKSSGNRCIVFMDTSINYAEVLVIYHKSDLPKNLGEHQWLTKLLQSEFPHLLTKAK